MTWDRKAPFNWRGLMHYCDRFEIANAERQGRPIDWLDADQPIERQLSLCSHARGRSASYFIMLDEFGQEHPMMVADFMDLARSVTLVCGVPVTVKPLKYVVAKRGRNYGLKLATGQDLLCHEDGKKISSP